MKPKYYTPKIEEFHIGFEYEVYDGEEWTEEEITLWTDLKALFICADKCPVPLRVKYLDTEDVKSFGFGVDSRGEYSIGCTYISWHTGDTRPSWVEITNDEDTLFYGTIKNKSELKVVLMQIGII